jgi:hypothetical protein
MMKQSMKRLYLLLLAAPVFLAACSKADEGENNDEEVITTVTLKIMPHTGSGNTLVFSVDDPDGPGGNAPIQQNVVLAANTMYHFELELLDKTKDPDADITGEVDEEGDAHRIYYLPSAGNSISVTGLNNDANGIPLGTTGFINTGAAGTGTLRVVLRHYGGNPPNKGANDAWDNSKSSSDVDVTFNTVVQ